RVVRAYAQEEAEIALFETSNQEYVTRSLPLARLTGMLWPTLEMLLGFALVLVLWLGGREVLMHKITLGDFVAFNTYIVMLTWPVIALGWVINIFQRGTASMGRINEILVAQPEITDAAVASDLKQTQTLGGEIEFRHLDFSYNGVPVLKDVSLTIPAGSSLAIVGPTGSGKTTLVSLLPRIYDAQPGSLLIDGRPIREFPLETLRRNIGFVPQETFLFSESVRENIAFGVETASDEQVRNAAEAANIAIDIEGFPEGYSTMVGERGITLSGGQKQRSAIARAIIRDPRILVLDDALSSVDTYTEEKILNHLREVMRDRTTIFISHRVSTVRSADRIAVLH
ncbi:MAG: ABC transporter ATP-binding protein, partial [Terriglobales bacterium]